MARPKRIKFVQFEPDITYFKPRGVPLAFLEEVIIPVEEFESLRLAELLNLEQSQAAKRMKISRTTFQRLLHSAHQKITDALVNGKAIKIEGGKYRVKKSKKLINK